MKKRNLLMLSAVCFILAGCNSLNPTLETIPNDTNDAASSQANISTEAIISTETSPKETTAAIDLSETTEEEMPATTTQKDETSSDGEPTSEDIISTDANGNLIIDITPSTTVKPSSSSGRMEAASMSYTKNKVTINYPYIVGMTDTATEDWANEEIYNNVMSIIDLYDVDIEEDSLIIDYEVLTIYRSQISIKYTGVLTKPSETVKFNLRFSDDLDLSKKKHIRLSDRLSAKKFSESILTNDKYSILYAPMGTEALNEYLKGKTSAYYTELLNGADFGGDELPNAFSYNYDGSIAIVIPLPHALGDYAEIMIDQQTK